MNDFATSAGHWYTLAGEPAYTIVGKNGRERPTTLADARKANLVPSYTTVVRCAAKPALERWKAEQLLLAGLTLPRLDDEPEAAWISRVWADSQEQSRKAAERGNKIHAAIERHFRGQIPEADHWEHVKGARTEIAKHCGEQTWFPERSFAHPLGYGGKCDLHSAAWVIDYKSKEFDADTLPKAWDEHPMQLAAYRRGLCVPEARCGILFVSATVPGLSVLRELPEADLQRGLGMFDCLLAYFQIQTGHRPALVREAA
jgi:hypothetical protein